MTTTTADTLAQLALFADLPRPQLEAIVHAFDEEVFGEGQRVLRRGFSGGNVYVILEGEASVVIDGRERLRLRRGDFFGEISALTGDVPNADVVAQSLLRCFVIPGPQIDGFLVDHPRVALRMLKTEARRLRNATEWR